MKALLIEAQRLNDDISVGIAAAMEYIRSLDENAGHTQLDHVEFLQAKILDTGNQAFEIVEKALARKTSEDATDEQRKFGALGKAISDKHTSNVKKRKEMETEAKLELERNWKDAIKVTEVEKGKAAGFHGTWDFKPKGMQSKLDLYAEVQQFVRTFGHLRKFELRRLQRSVSLNMVRKLGVLRGDRVKKCEEPHIKGKWCLRNQKAQYSCLKIEVNLFISHEQD
jgi:hypothetical protein